MNHDDTYDKDVLSQHWFTTYPNSVMLYRASAREAGRAQMYMRLVKQPSHFAPAFIKWFVKKKMFLPQNQGKLWMRLEGTCENLLGEK
jgi:hypothetical protein